MVISSRHDVPIHLSSDLRYSSVRTLLVCRGTCAHLYARSLGGPLTSDPDAARGQRDAWRRNERHSFLAAITRALLPRWDSEPNCGRSIVSITLGQVSLGSSAHP